MVVATEGSLARRNLADPILAEISEYDSYLKTTFPTYPNTLMFDNKDAAIVCVVCLLKEQCHWPLQNQAG